MRRVVESVRALADSHQDFEQDAVTMLDDIVLRDLYRLDPAEMEIVKSGTYL